MINNAKVYIVDDDSAVRDALSMLLEAGGYNVEAFQCAADFLATSTPSARGCIILDVDMPDMNGLAVQENLAKRGLRLPVIFLSGHGTIPISVRAIKAGAIDFLTKPVEGSVLLAQVQKAMEHGSSLQKKSDSSQSASLLLATLTGREREVLMLAISGHANKEIALRLGISFRTVEIHRAHVLKKAGVSNLLELTSIAGFIESLQAAS